MLTAEERHEVELLVPQVTVGELARLLQSENRTGLLFLRFDGLDGRTVGMTLAVGSTERIAAFEEETEQAWGWLETLEAVDQELAAAADEAAAG